MNGRRAKQHRLNPVIGFFPQRSPYSFSTLILFSSLASTTTADLSMANGRRAYHQSPAISPDMLFCLFGALVDGCASKEQGCQRLLANPPHRFFTAPMLQDIVR